MERIHKQIYDALDIFLDCYLKKRDIDKTLSCFHDSLVWVGTGEEEIANSKEELSSLLKRKFSRLPGTYDYKINQSVSRETSECLVTLYADVVLGITEENGFSLDMPCRITMSFIREEGVWLASLLHVSSPCNENGKEGFVPASYSSEKNRALQTILDEKSRELETTYSSIPGGVMKIRVDEKYTFLYCNDTFLKITGYTREEIETQFENSSLLLIHEDDRKSAVQSLKAQLENTGRAQLEYRINTKCGQPVWVLEQGQLVTNSNGENEFFSVVLDVTIDHRNRENLRLSEERYHIILDQIDDILCEWDISTDTISYSPNFEKIFGYSPVNDKFSIGEGLITHVHPSDLRFLREFITDTLHNTSPSAVEVRIQTITGRYIWMRIRASAVRDEYGVPKRVVGMITNINSQRLTIEDLRSKSQRDLLTDLYNKITAQQMVEERLLSASSNSSHALMIVDIDNFKSVNDSLGHMFGDTVLSDVATRLKAVFRSSDILGRVGGDEFIVFLSDINSSSVLAPKAIDIIDIFRNSYTRNGVSYKVSCSIGIAIAPIHGTVFDELYHNADRALYAAKNLGKDRYLIFSEDLASDTGESYSAVGAIDSIIPQDNCNRGNDLCNIVFNELYESLNLRSSIDYALGLIGEHISVNRAYVFEISENGLYASNTFEWCSDGIKPCIARLQNVGLTTFDGYFKNYNEAGVFACNDVSELDDELSEFLKKQGIFSTLQVYITDGGKIRGFIGFDDCSHTRVWSESEIGFLMHVSKVIGLFVIKRVSAEEIAHSHKNQMAILNGMDAFTYVINPIDHTLLYINKKTMDLIPGAKLGNTCYESFWDGRSAPCEICPMRGLGIDREFNTIEVYNHTLDLWTEATASKLPWIGADDAVLICCHDITKYKKK